MVGRSVDGDCRIVQIFNFALYMWNPANLVWAPFHFCLSKSASYSLYPHLSFLLTESPASASLLDLPHRYVRALSILWLPEPVH